jgi:non-specific serine/threonine protein kinase
VRAWGGFDDKTLQDHLTVIARICQRLEGLPLAIELAAGRCWDATFPEVLAQLEDRFQLLLDGPRDLPERHRALHDTIAWSYDLLPASEQALFRGLAVFAGGIEIDALETLFGAGATARANSLVEKNLLDRDARGAGRRLAMLESIREFAEEKLRAHREDVAMRAAHARYFADLVQRHHPSPAAIDQVEWARRMEREHDNLHLALAVSLANRAPEVALGLASGLGMYWFTHGCTADARRWIEEALAMEPVVPTEARAWSALWGAAIAWRMADPEAGERFEWHARLAWQALGSAQGLARVDHAIAIRMGLEGRVDESLRRHRANLEVFQELGDAEGIVFSLAGIAHGLGLTGEPEEALRHLDAALAAGRNAGNLMLQSYVLAQLPSACLAVGDGDRAGAAAREGERIARLIGDRRSLPWASLVQASLAADRNDHEAAYEHALAALAGFQDAGDVLNEWRGYLACLWATRSLGRLDESRAYARECARCVRPVGSAEDLATVLPEMACLLLALGYPAGALTMFAAGQAAGPDAAMWPDHHEDRIAAARTLLSPAAAAAAWNHGERTDVTDALELARRWIAAGSA